MCEIRPIGGSNISGSIEFFEEGGEVRVIGKIEGLAPGRHAIHVHNYGDLRDRDEAKSAGGHFNPTDQPHGSRIANSRHVGDLGNIEADPDGIASVTMMDDKIKLTGAHSIIGRSVVIHAASDSFTQPSGNAGARVAAGVIGLSKPTD